MKIFILVLMIAVIGWSRPATALPNHLWQILNVGGIYHGSDVNPNSCLKWYGLFETRDGFALKAVRLDVRAVRHTLLDTAGQKTGKKLSIQPSGETVFLVGSNRPLKVRTNRGTSTHKAGHGKGARRKSIKTGQADPDLISRKGLHPLPD